MGVVKKTLALALAAAILPGCGGDDKDGRQVDNSPGANAVSAKVLFNPAEGADFIPFPTDLLFASTADGSINIPDKLNSLDGAALLAATGDLPAQGALITAATSTPVAAALADPQTSLNTMDGWSNTAIMVVRFSDNIASPTDQTEDGLPDGVKIYATTTADPGAAGTVTIDRELVYGVDFVAGANGSSLLIIPVKPLDPSITHIITIDTDLKTTSGEAVSADDTFQLVNGAYQLEGAIGGTGGLSDFILDSSGDPCDFSDALSVADCTDVNTEDYQFVVDNVPPAAAGAAAVAGALGALEAAGEFESILLLEQLRRISSKQIDAVVGEGADPTALSLVYSVTTQDVGTALLQARSEVEDADSAAITILNPLPGWDDGSDEIPFEVISPGADGDLSTPDHAAHMYLGVLSDMLSFVDPTDANNTVWEAEQDPGNWLGGPCAALPAAATGSANLVACNQYLPEAKLTDHSVPVLVSAPRQESLDGDPGPWSDCSGGELPVVIYQHGITSNRASLLALADSLAQACVVGVAIDLPKHGILPVNDPFGASSLAQLQQALQQPPFVGAPNPTPTIERLVTTANPAEGCSAGAGESTLPDNGDFYCPSGDNFINLANLANSRDTLRQGVTDLHTLRLALSNEDAAFEAAIGTTIDEEDISFIGVSLGGLVGMPFLGTATDLDLSTGILNVTSGNIAKLLDGSPTFGPSIADGLFASGGISKPSGDYEGFLIIAQTHVDNADPINFAETVGENGPPMLVQEVIGSGDATACVLDGEGCPDQVVPNNLFGSSFGGAWGVIDQINAGLAAPSQSSFLAGQDFFSTPVALTGTDALAQGTAFVGLASLLSAGAIDVPTAAGTGVTDNGSVLVGAFGTPGFKGLNLGEVFACGALGAPAEGIVRFTSGSHSSLLSPTADLNTTVAMQTQVATYIASGGASIAADPNADDADQVVRSSPLGPCAP